MNWVINIVQQPTLTHCAASHGQVGVVSVLLDGGASIEAKNNVSNCLRRTVSDDYSVNILNNIDESLNWKHFCRCNIYDVICRWGRKVFIL